MNEKEKIALLIFTCEGRELLLQRTLRSFYENVDYQWHKIILAIDGKFDEKVIEEIKPDLIVQHFERKGYASNAASGVSAVDTEYFFWLEDDWKFHKPLAITEMHQTLKANPTWVEILLCKTGVLTAEQKANPLKDNYYESLHGFSTNPSLVQTVPLKEAFTALLAAKKGDRLGEDGFENFLGKYLIAQRKSSALLDPVEGTHISHEGYLESTPRSWHMTNSLEGTRTQEHLMTIPVPAFWRRISMIFKLMGTFFKLMIVQLYNNKIYEFCFRIVSSSTSTLKNKD